MKDPRASMPPGGSFRYDEEKIKKILAGDMKTLIDYANELGEYFARGKGEKYPLTTSQIRNVLNEIQKMPEKQFDENRLQLLRPKLAYAAVRHRDKVMKDFQTLLDKVIQLTDKNNFKNFKHFVEAIVAYHRYHGDK
jgi:CRISPR type III-A-associated protein Csm2